jgi:hypothetical protein
MANLKKTPTLNELLRSKILADMRRLPRRSQARQNANAARMAELFQPSRYFMRKKQRERGAVYPGSEW